MFLMCFRLDSTSSLSPDQISSPSPSGSSTDPMVALLQQKYNNNIKNNQNSVLNKYNLDLSQVNVWDLLTIYCCNKNVLNNRIAV